MQGNRVEANVTLCQNTSRNALRDGLKTGAHTYNEVPIKDEVPIAFATSASFVVTLIDGDGPPGQPSVEVT